MMFCQLAFEYQRFSIHFHSLGNWQRQNNISKIKQKTNRKPWIGWFQRMRHDLTCSTENLVQLTIISIINVATFGLINIVISHRIQAVLRTKHISNRIPCAERYGFAMNIYFVCGAIWY